MELIGCSFQADRSFKSLPEAAEFLLHEYVQELPAKVWREQPSGLLSPQFAPIYLFRGECGHFPTTVAGSHRRDSYCLGDGRRRLASADLNVVKELIPSLARRFSDND